MPRADTLIHRWFDEVWNKGRETAIDEFMAPDCDMHGLTDAAGNELRTVDAFKAYWRQIRAMFPDIQIVVEDALIDEDRLAARCTVTGTHTASGKRVNFTGLVLARHRDGRFVDAWNAFDFTTMQQQLA